MGIMMCPVLHNMTIPLRQINPAKYLGFGVAPHTPLYSACSVQYQLLRTTIFHID